MGGEKRYHKTRYPIKKGSPPRGRGKGICPGTCFTVNGITPAWAGKSGKKSKPGPNGKDHPRVGGEKASKPCVAVSG